MNCDELRDHYELYTLGFADDPELSEIRAHLERACPTCVPGVRGARELITLIGAAAAFLPNLMPKLGEGLRPAMKSTVRASYKFAQKTREVFAEASEQVQDMVAEAKLDSKNAAPEPAAPEPVPTEVQKRPTASKAKA